MLVQCQAAYSPLQTAFTPCSIQRNAIPLCSVVISKCYWSNCQEVRKSSISSSKIPTATDNVSSLCMRTLQKVRGKLELRYIDFWHKIFWNPCKQGVFKRFVGNAYYEKSINGFQTIFAPKWTYLLILFSTNFLKFHGSGGGGVHTFPFSLPFVIVNKNCWVYTMSARLGERVALLYWNDILILNRFQLIRWHF